MARNRQYKFTREPKLPSCHSVARDSLFTELLDVMSHHGELSQHEKLYLLNLVVHKVKEKER